MCIDPAPGNVQLGFMSPTTKARNQTVLALQGGGSHGAFTWGALDRLLEDGLEFGAVSGVSSGALIGAMAVQGTVRGGRAGARVAIRRLWERVAAAHIFGGTSASSPFDWLWGWDKGREFGNEMAWQGLTNTLKLFSPGQLNPFGQNPLEPVLTALLDLPAIRDPAAPRLYVAATDVESGQAKVFDNDQISIPVLLASCCIPMMFPTVLIGGRHYWDGGYSCNPALAPLVALSPEELVLIRAQPRVRAGVPSSTADIVHRLHEIAFQAPLDAELLMLPSGIRLREVSADVELARHPLTSKMNTERAFLDDLYAAGRRVAGLAEAA